MNFNLIPYDSEAYLIAADYAEEQGNLVSNAIRKGILPLDSEKGNGEGIFNSYGMNSGNGQGVRYVNNPLPGIGFGDYNDDYDDPIYSYGEGSGWGVGDGRGFAFRY